MYRSPSGVLLESLVEDRKRRVTGIDLDRIATVQHVDSLRVDSLGNIRKELLEEVMTSTQFVNQINTELAKAKAIAAKPAPQLESTAEMSQVNDQRKAVVARIAHLVARLDSVQTRLARSNNRTRSIRNCDER